MSVLRENGAYFTMDVFCCGGFAYGMKVLMINVVCGIRSTGRICTDLAAALEAQGHEVKIAYGRENVPEELQKYAVRIGTDFDVRLHGVKARLLDGAGFGSRRPTERFIQWVKAYDPDVIHLHNIHGYYIHVGVLFDYLKKCGKRIIWTLHDCWSFTGHTAYCDAVQCERWEAGCFQCPQRKTYPKAMIDRSRENWHRKKEIFSGVPNLTVVTPSYWLAGLVKRSFLKEYPVEVIHNGIDTSQFKRLDSDFKEKNHLQGKTVLLGVATSWDDLKGLSDFIRLSEKLDETDRIVLVGVAGEVLPRLPKNILGIRRTSSVKELACIYNAADVFLNLSYCESYSMVNLEARACGTPVITYRTGGCPESAGKDCIVVEQGDMDGLIAAIKRMKENPIVPEGGNFDKQVTLARYLEVYSGQKQ